MSDEPDLTREGARAWSWKGWASGDRCCRRSIKRSISSGWPNGLIRPIPVGIPGYFRPGRRFSRTPPERVRAVILGQDPYPTKAHADGLAFSAREGIRPLPRSLQNILKELREDVGITPSHGAGDLSVWADRGVLLLTVYEGAAGSHGRWGWERFTAQALRLTRALPQPVAYLLWGGHAQNTAVGAGIPRSGEGVFVSAHPSPLSAGRGFFGSRPFSRVNAFLRERGGEEIDWSL